MPENEMVGKIRKELHDGLGGTLSKITMLSHYGRLQDDPIQMRETFLQIAELSGSSLIELRVLLNLLAEKVDEVEIQSGDLSDESAQSSEKNEANSKFCGLLIVEDDPCLNSVLMRILEKEQIFSHIESCGSAEEALDFLEVISPEIVLLDLGLPGMGGVELIENIVSNNPTVTVMVYTVFEDTPTVFSAIKAGASGYILKDCSPEELKESLKLLLSGGAPMTPRIAQKVFSEFQKLKKNQTPILSTREETIIRYIELGLSYSEVAEHLCISPHTVHTHIKKIYKKLRATGRQDVLQRAKEEGII